MKHDRPRRIALDLLVLSTWLSGFVASLAVRAQDVPPSLAEYVADEPDRPRARTAIPFQKSLRDARVEAERSHRRILTYFTGRHCSWCRVMEKRTFTDAEVVALSKEFVWLKLDLEEEPQLADELGVDTIPQSFILTSEGERIDRLTGYRPAAEYVDWLRSGLTKPHEQPGKKTSQAPSAVGAAAEETDLLIWFVDGRRTMKQWSEPKAFDHPQLLQILRASGASPRVEHLDFSHFPARWERAAAAGRLPDLIASERAPATVLDLAAQGRLLAVGSQRLTFTPGLASCPDFARRSLHLLHDGPHETALRRAVQVILQPGPETDLPGSRLPATADPDGAEQAARRAAAGYMGGDPRMLKNVASETSPQLARCIKASAWRRGLKVQTGSVEIRGGKDLAFARVEASYRSDKFLGADPLLVVLRQESGQWKALAVSHDVESWKGIPNLLGLMHPRDDAAAPATPRLVWPPDQALLANSKRPLSWEVPEGGEAIVAQICMLMSEEGVGAPGESWPASLLIARPDAPRDGSVPTDAYATGMPLSWCVWSVGVGGRTSVSEVRNYDFADYQQSRSSR